MVSVVIPSYNEESRIGSVLEAVVGSKSVDEVVVDDGSTIHVEKVIHCMGVDKSKIRVIRHDKNLGKAQALKSGVVAARSEVVMLVDADLVGLTTIHIDRMLEGFFSGRFDIVLGDREREFVMSRWLGFSVICTGERVLNRNLLLGNMDLFDEGKGYYFEIAMNRRFFGKYKIGICKMSGVGQRFKLDKEGWVGFCKDVAIWLGDIKYLGWNEFVMQLNYCRSLEKV